jgi:hypothetical protein
MPLFRYPHTEIVADNETVILKIVLPDPGSASHHIIDLPGPDDVEGDGDIEVTLGTGAQLKAERTIVFSNPVNVSPHATEVRIRYFLNDKLIVDHSNQKSVDVSPQLKVTLKFK